MTRPAKPSKANQAGGISNLKDIRKMNERSMTNNRTPYEVLSRVSPASIDSMAVVKGASLTANHPPQLS